MCMYVCRVLSKEIVEGYFLTFEIEEMFFKKKTLHKSLCMTFQNICE